MSLEEKTEAVCREFVGFREWLDGARGSRIFSYLVTGIKREIVALDYNKEEGFAALILKERIDRIARGDREVIFYKVRKEPYEIRGGLPSEMESILNSSVDVKIKLKEFKKSKTFSPDSLPFELSGTDCNGRTTTGTFYYTEKIEALD